MRVNLNAQVKVRLTDIGRKIFDDNQRRDLGLLYPKYKLPVEEDSEGWSEWTLYSLMHEFGPKLINGGDVPFVDLEIEIPIPQGTALVSWPPSRGSMG